MNAQRLAAAAARVGNRQRSRRRSAAAGVCGLAILMVATSACGATGDAGADAGALKIAVNSAPDSFNPALENGARGFGLIPLSLSYAALFHETVGGTIQPELATAWHYDNSDPANLNTTFEFTLRPDAKFSDGTPVTAQSVVGWLNYFIRSKGLFVGSFGPDPTFTATDPLTVKIQMTAPDPDLPTLLSDEGDNAGFVVSPQGVADPSLLNNGSYGAGQYRLQASQTVNGDHYTYVPNPYYYDKPSVHWPEVYVKVIDNPSSRLEAQQSGQFQVTLGDSTTEAAAQAAGLTVKTAPQGMFFLSLDLRHDVGAPALRNVEVRRAINYAIDRNAIAKALFGPGGVPEWGFVTADPKSSSVDFHYDYDVAKAKQLLAKAGYANGFSLDLVCSGYFGNYGDTLMNAVAQYLQAIGINARITCFPDQASFSSYVYKYKSAMIQTQDQFDVTPAVYPLYLAASSPIAFYGGDPEIDRLYQQGAASTDPSKYWNQMWQRFTSQAYTVPLVELPNIYFVSKGIGGVQVSDVDNTALPTAWYPTSSS